jgi:hypothetical protein
MSNLRSHAEYELKKAGWDVEDSTTKDVLRIVDIFAEMGHSGSSAPWCIGIIKRLLSFEPLTELVIDPDEWIDHGNGLYQSRRCSEVFHDETCDANEAYTINGKVFSDDGGYTWFTNHKSRVKFKLPGFVPERQRVHLSADEEE